MKTKFSNLLTFLLLSVSCFAQLPNFTHVVVVLEENHNYSSVIGSSSMPYLNSLASTYGLGMQYYANTHPSIGNYFELTTGQVITNNDNFNGVVKADNIVRHLIGAGKTWKSYEEDLPSAGYIKPDIGNYVRHHCPLSYMQDVISSSAQRMNLVPFTQFATDFANGTLPDYSFVTPNLCNDAHDCTLDIADAWLKTNIDPLLKSSSFQNGLLIIVFDESANDNTHGGGRVAWVAVSPTFSKPGYSTSTLYQHQNTLRLMMEGLGLTTFPGQARNANNMSEFFQ